MKAREAVAKGLSGTLSSWGLVFVLFLFGTFWNILNLMITQKMDPTNTQTATVTVVIGVLFILTSIFMQAGSLGFVIEKVKTGASHAGAFTASGAKFYFKLLLLGILVAVVVGALVLAAVLLISVLAANLEIVGVIVGLFFAALGIYFALLVFLAPYAIVADNFGVIAAVKRSITLVRKNILGVIAVVLFMVLIGFVLGLILGIIFTIFRNQATSIQFQVLFSVLSSFVNAFLGVVVMTSFTNFYLSVSNNTPA